MERKVNKTVLTQKSVENLALARNNKKTELSMQLSLGEHESNVSKTPKLATTSKKYNYNMTESHSPKVQTMLR